MSGRMRFGLVLWLLLAAMLFGAALAESYEASNMRLAGYTGDVAIEDANGLERYIMVNARFADGEALRTGAGARAGVSLDATKMVTLDEKSRVQFRKDGGKMELTLTQGALFLDVSEKLDENESLDIRTSTMTIGIRGTIVHVRQSAAADRPTTILSVLEGTAHISYEQNRETKTLDVPAGQKVVLDQSESQSGPALIDLTPADMDVFIGEQLQNEELRQRAEAGAPKLFEEYDYPADGDWEYTGVVTIVAQSASKLYDGQPLTRRGNILVYGLPDIFNISAEASGSRTAAGISSNPVGHYAIYNSKGEDVTRHFADIRTVAGQLVVDPAPMTIWTGSAVKTYDGTPLTNEEAGFDIISGVRQQAPWHNSSLVLSEESGETLYGVSGSILVHGTNPLTGDNKEQVLQVGQKLTVYLSDEEDKDSIAFRIEPVSEEDLPEAILRLYADNPALLAAACEEAGWDQDKLLSRIALLRDTTSETTVKDGLTMRVDVSGGYVRELANARINVDSSITGYSGRALDGEEAHFTEVRIDDSVTVTATGSQTEVGESENTYTIDWGNEDKNNFTVSEELGKLRVLPEGNITITASSGSKTYDGKPLKVSGVIVTGLPSGYTCTAQAGATRTDAGSSQSVVESWSILDENGEDVSEHYHVKIMSGTATVLPAPLSVTTGSAEKVYDGTPLVNEEASLSGLVADESASIIASGQITDAGTVSNSYTIEWGSAKQKNYTISETLGTLTIQPVSLNVDMGAGPATYNGSLYVPTPTVTYQNGSHAGESVSGTRLRAMEIEYRYSLFTGDSVNIIITGSGSDAGSYTLSASCSFSGNAANVALPQQLEQSVTVAPAPLSVNTSSESKVFDGTALTGEAELNGLVGADEGTVSVSATGTITKAGTAQNTYAIHWNGVSESNYTLTESLGTLEVTPNTTPITVTSGDGYMRYKPYDCIVKNSDYTVEGLPDGFTLRADITGEQSWEVGSSPNTIASCTILSADGEDVTDCFTNISTVEGTLTVDKAILSIWSDDSEKTYDGMPLQGGTIHWTGIYGMDNAQNGIRIYHNASLTDAGTASDAFTVYWNYPELESLYEISEAPGTLTVTKAPLSIITSSADKPYDGLPLTSTDVTVTGLAYADQSKVTVTATGSITEVGTAENGYTIDWGGVNSANYVITEELGILEVTPAPRKALVVVIKDGSKVYDGFAGLFYADGAATVSCAGVALSPTGYAGVDGRCTYDYTLDGGDSFTLTIKDTGLNVGTYPITGSISFTSGDASNYDISITNGTCTVLPLGISVDVGGGGSAVYSGAAGTPGAISAKYTNGPRAGEALTSGGGAILEDRITATFTLYTDDGFSIESVMPTEVGTHTLSDGARFSSGSASNYSISYSNNTFTVEALKIGITLYGGTFDYSGDPMVADVSVQYLNGERAGDSPGIDYAMGGDMTLTLTCTLLSGDTMTVTVPPSGVEAGSYEIRASHSISGTASRYAVSSSGCTIIIQ